MEIWKDVPDYDNYEISNLANIRNKKTKYFLQKGKNIERGIYKKKDGKTYYRGSLLEILAFSSVSVCVCLLSPLR